MPKIELEISQEAFHIIEALHATGLYGRTHEDTAVRLLDLTLIEKRRL